MSCSSNTSVDLWHVTGCRHSTCKAGLAGSSRTLWVGSCTFCRAHWPMAAIPCFPPSSTPISAGSNTPFRVQLPYNRSENATVPRTARNAAQGPGQARSKITPGIEPFRVESQYFGSWSSGWRDCIWDAPNTTKYGYTMESESVTLPSNVRDGWMASGPPFPVTIPQLIYLFICSFLFSIICVVKTNWGFHWGLERTNTNPNIGQDPSSVHLEYLHQYESIWAQNLYIHSSRYYYHNCSIFSV